ncbi:MAG: endonuclease III [Clostridia bacterium]|nr:endonuclease III [Clostridia bacterium]MBR2735368.1 endonuclease III [Clostridia bacterium]
MDQTSKAKIVVEKLEKMYPDATCSLNYSSALQLLIATRLSAQCTDARVNIVTPALFDRFKSAEDFAEANPEEIAEYIHSCGFFRTKSKDIVDMCKIIVSEFDGEVPSNMEDLTSLPGVGRKTANLVLGIVYGKPGIVVDTHFSRVTNRLGFHNTKNPEKIEKIMLELIPPEVSQKFGHQLVTHGRNICKAVKPKCEQCDLKSECDYYAKNKN